MPFSRKQAFPLPIMTPGEEEAERIYELLRAGRMGERSLLANFWCLERLDKAAAWYLAWLLKQASEAREQPTQCQS